MRSEAATLKRSRAERSRIQSVTYSYSVSMSRHLPLAMGD